MSLHLRDTSGRGSLVESRALAIKHAFIANAVQAECEYCVENLAKNRDEVIVMLKVQRTYKAESCELIKFSLR